MRPDLESRLRDRLSEDGYLFPDYGDYCFANVPDTVQTVLGLEGRQPLPADVHDGVGERFDHVLVVLVDGFGLEFWKRHGAHPLLERIEAHGTITPLTATYPSETAAAVTTFHTGRRPAEHGIIGWNVYEPELDAAFEAFSVTSKGGREPSGLLPRDVYAGEPLYPTLRDAGIDCRHVVPFEATYDGAIAHTYDYDDLASFERRLGEAHDVASEPAYLFAYLPHVDHAAHEAGTGSRTYREAVGEVLDALEQALVGLDDGRGETLVVLTADHGHIDTDPDRNVDLESFGSVLSNLERHAHGEPVRYAGSPRNVHLHLEDDAIDSVRETLLAELDALVLTRAEILERGLFGDYQPSDRFRRRLGDLVVSHRELSVWYGDEPDELDLIGMHGGLHPDEMLVPFAAVRLDRLE